MRVLVRILLAAISLLYGFIGAFLVILGSIYGAENFPRWTGSELNIAGVLAIAVGGVCILLCILGIITSCSHSFALSYCYAFVIFFALLVQGVLAILVVFFRPEIQSFIEASLKQTLSSYVDGEAGSFYQNSISRIWDDTQSSLGCCGVYSFTDWQNVEYGSKNRVPYSCCTQASVNSGNTLNGGITVNNPSCGLGIIWDSANPTIYQDGCSKYLALFSSDYLAIILGVAAGLFALQIFGVCFSCCLGRSVQVEDCHVD